MENTSAKATKIPNIARYTRVLKLLQGDHFLQQFVGKHGTVAIANPTGGTVDFPAEAVYVTDHIHLLGFDANTYPRIELMQLGHRLLVTQAAKWPAGPLIPLSRQALEPAAPSKVPPQKRAPVKAGAAKPAPAAAAAPAVPPVSIPKPAPIPEPVALPKAEAPKPAPKARPAPKTKVKAEVPVAVSAAPPAFNLKTATKSGSSQAGSATLYVRPYILYSPGVAICSLLHAAVMILQAVAGEGDAESKALEDRLVALTDEISKRVVLPSAPAEKETPVEALLPEG